MSIPITTKSPLTAELAGTIATQLLFFWFPSAIYLSIPLLFPRFSLRHKMQPSQTPPTWTQLRHCTLVVITNQLLGLALQSAMHISTLHLLGLPAYQTTPATAGKVARDLLLALPLCELLFYSSHALLHAPRLYRRFHRVHHSFTAPVALAAQFAHPLEYVLTCFVPVMVAPAVVRANVVSVWVLVGLVGLESCSVHSGYKVGGLAVRHDRHHQKGARGGFGTFAGLDWAFGTEMKVRTECLDVCI